MTTDCLRLAEVRYGCIFCEK